MHKTQLPILIPKMNIWKSTLKRMLPIIAPKTNNYLGIQLTKHAQDWDAVNYTNL